VVVLVAVLLQQLGQVQQIIGEFLEARLLVVVVQEIVVQAQVVVVIRILAVLELAVVVAVEIVVLETKAAMVEMV